MVLYLKNELVSPGGSSFVVDAAGTKVYSVKGKIFSISRKKYVLGPDGKRLFMVRNKVFRLFRHSAFVYGPSGEKIMKITKAFFTHKYTAKGYSSSLLIDGNIVGFNFSVLRDGVSIGRIFREFAIFRDSFGLEAYAKEDEPLLIALVIAIDNIIDNIRKD